ncbi:MAG: hypothetical protein JSS62_05200 [Verrucomicrobia bacterium]|nr:hypothetical protein [Verrucomicrobiota bacterium]MBS0647455.1 hypothetical protein [Verrucomicrobiota bacterium]
MSVSCVAVRAEDPLSSTKNKQSMPRITRAALQAQNAQHLSQLEKFSIPPFYYYLLSRWLATSPNPNLAIAVARIKDALSSGARSLDLSNLGLESCPPLDGLYGQLTDLDLSGNRLVMLPSHLGLCSNLKRLHLTHNLLTALPAELNQLRALRGLHASHNQLSYLPSLENLTHLLSLELNHNRFSVFPDAILQLPNIQWLYLQHNQLTRLPANIDHLVGLRGLYLTNNAVAALPPNFTCLTQLTILNVAYNRLSVLPDSLSRLTTLVTLDLSFNPDLQELPLGLSQLSELTSLDCQGTLILPDLPQEILRICRAHKQGSFNFVFQERLSVWHVASRREGTAPCLATFTETEQRAVSNWLSRLESSKDFHGHQQALTATVCNILDTAVTDSVFKEDFLIPVSEMEDECEDRAAMIVNEVYLTWRLSTLFATATLQEKLHCLAAGAKTIALRHAVAEKIDVYEKHIRQLTKNPKFVFLECVESYLYYETSLRLTLGLLSFIQTMNHDEEIGRLDDVTPESLIPVVKTNYLRHLAELSIFQKLAKQDAACQRDLDALHDSSQNQLTAIYCFLKARDLNGALDLEAIPDDLRALLATMDPPKSEQEYLAKITFLGLQTEEAQRARMLQWFHENI